LPDSIQVIPICLPGREHRFRQPPFHKMSDLATALVPEIRAHVGTPMWLFGHSLGGLVAFEAARDLILASAESVAGLFIAACPAPQSLEVRHPLHPLPDDLFLSRLLDEYGLVGKDRDAEIQLMRMLLPTLRADIEIMETYGFEEREPLPCPLSVFGGTDDARVSRVRLEAWRAQTRAAFSCRLFPGGHFFVQQHPEPLIRAIADRILGDRR
ncbi:MAG TPA: alpha/beta fold hydrolase, partial [Pirellulaceae bacterium]